MEGIVPLKVKELMGLVASLVLRCDESIYYHLVKCKENGVSTEELSESIEIAMIVGGSITIPHIRKAYKNCIEMQD
jgi:alkylhydroperoxidase/carboxymuconolactone decarboxylase family protein YurZ